MGELAKHQIAASWSNELEDHLPWLEREYRERFLESVLLVILYEWSGERLSFFLAGEHYAPEVLAADIIREFRERYGDD